MAINYLPSEENNAKEVIRLIEEAGRKAVALPGDIADETFCKELVEKAARELGGIDILVNNAGRQTAKKSIEELTTEQFDNTFKVNVYALFWITKAALSHMEAGAAIINTTSIQAFQPSEILLDYAQTKSSIVAFTKALSQQVAEKGIRVNAVAPGPILDSSSALWWTAPGKIGKIWSQHTAEAARSTGRDCPYVCAARITGSQLYHR